MADQLKTRTADGVKSDAEDAEPNGPAPSSRGGTLIRGAGAAEAVALLDAWAQGDADEQRETWEFLRKALDDDRLSNRRLFS